MSILDRIDSPADVRALTEAELPGLAAAVRARLIDVCSRTGGHIGAGLGVVELAVALHYVFETPVDQLVWDVGHQGYPHKVLTGRNSRLETLRTEGGLSAFLKRGESPYDAFGAGHAATSISAALGIACARDLKGEAFKVAAIIGDGSLTSGLAYEALNNAGHSGRDLIVILNDNEMSIAPNVGAMAQYLNQVQRNPIYNRVRDRIGEFVEGHGVLNTWVRKWEEAVKSFLTPGVLFEELGFRYFGPIDGHDLGALVETLALVRARSGPRLVHVLTQKGKGFPATAQGVASVEKWHALPPGHDPATGKARVVMSAVPAVPPPSAPTAPARPTYTAVFGQGLVAIMAVHPDVVTITAAMPSGTGTGEVAKAYPSRFFDVGIAEGHAVTFAAGLATQELRPVVAIYSTFLQRAYDNLIHDVALQGLPVVFALDRAGLVGEDGETHQGLYDIAYLLAVPGLVVTAPKDGAELLGLLQSALAQTAAPVALRYPRDVVPDATLPIPPLAAISPVPLGTWEVLRSGHDGVALLAVGPMVQTALVAAETLAAEGLDVTVVNCRTLKPHDAATLEVLCATHRTLLVVEEGTVVNGFGAYLGQIVAQHETGVRVLAHGVPDRIIVAAPRARQLAQCGLDAAGIAARVRALRGSEALAG